MALYVPTQAPAQVPALVQRRQYLLEQQGSLQSTGGKDGCSHEQSNKGTEIIVRAGKVGLLF